MEENKQMKKKKKRAKFWLFFLPILLYETKLTKAKRNMQILERFW